MNKKDKLRRCLLFMPGDSQRKIEKGAKMDVDVIIMDLEDGVAFNQKAAARETVARALYTLDFGRSERLVRLNAPLADVGEVDALSADLRATALARPDGYIIPKVESAEQVHAVSGYLDGVEMGQNWTQGSIRLMALIETARGIMNVREIAQSSRRLDALMFGAEDLAGDIGAQRTRTGWEVFYARSAVVTAAAAYGLQAIDTVFVDLNDTEALESESVFVRQMGYAGKMAIHPRQVEVIQRVFAPSPQEIAHAQHVVDAFEEHQAAGAGAFELDGKMVDMPVVKAARNILTTAKLAGLV